MAFCVSSQAYVTLKNIPESDKRSLKSNLELINKKINEIEKTLADNMEVIPSRDKLQEILNVYSTEDDDYAAEYANKRGKWVKYIPFLGKRYIKKLEKNYKKAYGGARVILILPFIDNHNGSGAYYLRVIGLDDYDESVMLPEHIDRYHEYAKYAKFTHDTAKEASICKRDIDNLKCHAKTISEILTIFKNPHINIDVIPLDVYNNLVNFDMTPYQRDYMLIGEETEK